MTADVLAADVPQTHKLCGHCSSFLHQWRVIAHDPLTDQVVQLPVAGKMSVSSDGGNANEKEVTGKRYWGAPMRSRYLRQNVSVPNSLLIVLKSPFAAFSLTEIFDGGSDDCKKKSETRILISGTHRRGMPGASTVFA